MRNTAGGVAEVVRWFSSSGMDLPNCAKSSRVSGQDSGRKGHQQKVEKGETLQWKSTGENKKTSARKMVEKEKWNNNKEMV